MKLFNRGLNGYDEQCDNHKYPKFRKVKTPNIGVTIIDLEKCCN